MKQLISIAAIFLIFLAGCSKDVNINGPIELQTTNGGTEKIIGEYFALEAPIEADPEIDTSTVSEVKEIDGTIGGVLSIDQNVVSNDGRIVNVKARFQVTPGAFTGNQTISMTADVNNGCLTFSPQMNFNQYCKLDYEIKNINLTNLGFTQNTSAAYFVYFHNSGLILPVLNSGVTFNLNQGVLKVNSARIYHFSRYGFVRSNE